MGLAPCRCFGSLSASTEHARYVYKLQESESLSEESDDQDWDSDDSSSTQRFSRLKPLRKRMSLLTGQYVDVPTYNEHPHGSKTSKRRFFQSAARWDEEIERVLVGGRGVFSIPRTMTVAALMEAGGKFAEDPVIEEPMNVEEEWDDAASFKMDI